MEVILGYIAAIFTTLSFLPQVLRVILTKQTRDISRNIHPSGLGSFTLVLLWNFDFGYADHTRQRFYIGVCKCDTHL